MPKRRAIPRRIKDVVRATQEGFCGCTDKCQDILPPDGDGLVQYDHQPPLKLRAAAADDSDWDPPQHDPEHIVAMVTAHHRAKTSHPRGRHTSIDSDQHAIAKVRRLRGELKPRKKQKLPSRKMVSSKRAWPKRTFQQRKPT